MTEEHQLSSGLDLSNSRKKILLLVFLVFLTIILGLTGSYFLNQNKNSNKNSTTRKTSTNSAETSNWLTYIDQTYNVSYKYPPDWEIKTQGSVAPGCTPGVGLKRSNLNFGICEKKESTLNNEVADRLKNSPDLVVTNINVDGHTAAKLKYLIGDGSTVLEYDIQITEGGKSLILSASAYSNNLLRYSLSDFEQVVDDVVYSLKFL